MVKTKGLLVVGGLFLCLGLSIHSWLSAHEWSSEFDGTLSTLQGHKFQACGEGLNAFSNSVHKMVRSRCTTCHENNSGPATGPSFAIENVNLSYERIRRYVNFANIPSSYFVRKGGNQHCVAHGVNCEITHDDVLRELNAWWESGEKICPQNGKFFTGRVAIPAQLPNRDQGYTMMRWDLGSASPDFAGSVLEIEVQRFADRVDASPGGYRFRKPRLVARDYSLKIKDLKILINGKYDVLANAYVGIKQSVNAGPTGAVLSARPMIVIQDQAQGDEALISFEVLRKAAPVQCNATKLFSESVGKLVEVRNCRECHMAAGTAGNRMFPMDSDTNQLCADFLQRTDFNRPLSSASIEYAYKGVNGHLKVIPSLREVVPIWTNWIQAESAGRGKVTYREIAPLLVENKCVECHNPERLKGKLDLSRFPFTHRGSAEDQNQIVRVMIERMENRDDPMPSPPADMVNVESVEKFKTWLDDGLPE
jgi:mono/diheme cytochrome c family protein